MTKSQVAKLAAKNAAKLLRDEAQLTYNDFIFRTRNAEGDDYELQNAILGILLKSSAVYRGKAIRLHSDSDEINRDLWDECAICENMPHEIVEGSIGFEAEFYRHACNVVASNAEGFDIDINDSLGYVIY